MTVGILRFDHDKDEHVQNLIFRDLHDDFRDMPFIRVVAIDRLIDTADPDEKQREESLKFAHASGATVVIWGDVTTAGSAEALHPYWTTTNDVPADRPIPFSLQNQLVSLDPIFEKSLADVLGLVVATSATTTLVSAD